MIHVVHFEGSTLIILTFFQLIHKIKTPIDVAPPLYVYKAWNVGISLYVMERDGAWWSVMERASPPCAKLPLIHWFQPYSTSPPLACSPSHFEKGRTRIFLWNPPRRISWVRTREAYMTGDGVRRSTNAPRPLLYPYDYVPLYPYSYMYLPLSVAYV